MSRKAQGRIYTRGKQNRYYLQYYLNGKEIRVALKDVNGNPVSSMKEALKARDRIMKTVSETDELERWKNVADKIASEEHRVEDSIREAKEAETKLINSRATVEDGFNLFLDCEHRPRSCRGYSRGDVIPHDTTIYNNRAYYKHFADWLTDIKVTCLGDVTHDMAVKFISGLQQSLSSNTVNKHINFLFVFYRTLIQDGKVMCENPFDGMERDLQDDSYSKRPLPLEKVGMLFEKSSGQLRVLFMLGYYIGLRRGDCAMLRWNEVSLEREVVERIPSKTRRRVKDKTKSMVKVGIPLRLKKELEKLDRTNEFVLPEMARLYQPGKRAVLSRMIKSVFESCGIQTEQMIDGKLRSVYGFHSLRYSYINHHAEIGTPQVVIQKNAGHSNPAMTEHYERVSDEAAVRFASRFDSDTQSPKARLRQLVDSMTDEEALRVLAFLSSPQNKPLGVESGINDKHEDLRPVGLPKEINDNPGDV